MENIDLLDQQFYKLLMYLLKSFIKCMMQMAYKYDISRKIV